MNFKQFGSLLPDNPLCGISTYKDELNLATGACTRRIKKLVLDGTENWVSKGNPATFRYENSPILHTLNSVCYCSHFKNLPWQQVSTTNNSFAVRYTSAQNTINIRCEDYSAVEDFKAYLATQHANGTPVTVWYVLATPTTETITVPSGLSGTEEGYLNQSGAPTPTNPIYPTANTVEKLFDINHYIMGTSTDTLTALPAIIYPNDTTATVGLKGNMSQTGTPTPDSPVMPQETGERTGNLFDEIYPSISGTIRYKPIYVGDGTFTLSTTTPYDSSVANIFLLSGDVSSGASTPNNGAWLNHKVTAQSDNGYVTIAYRHYTGTTSPETCSTMLSVGSTPQPYEPYGYKIPISSANTTTPVYLGEVETTRKIRKLVLTGREGGAWSPNPTIHNGNAYYNASIFTNYKPNMGVGYCTHYPLATTITDTIGVFFGGNINFITDFSEGIDTRDKWITYLQQQYDAGTPVTIWYVLASETTAVVNEPLMKIGDYADTVSGITIPTIAGKDTFDVLTTLKPSEVNLAYTGWHDATVKEWDGSEWQ